MHRLNRPELILLVLFSTLWQLTFGIEIPIDTAFILRQDSVIRAIHSTHLDSALMLGEENLIRCRNLNYTYGEFRTVHRLVTYYSHRGDLERAEELALSNIRLADSLKHPLRQYDAKFKLALVYQEKAKFEAALELLFECIKLQEDLLHNEEQIIDIYTSIGRIYAHSQNHHKAREYFQKALDGALQFDNLERKINGYNHMGISFMVIEKDPSLALPYFNKALALAKLKGDKQGFKSGAYGNLAQLHQDLGNSDSALYYCRLALQLNLRSQDTRNFVNNLSNLAMIFEESAQSDSALFYHRKALNLANKYGYLEQKRALLHDMANAFEAIGAFDSAFLHIKQFQALNDSLFGLKNASKLATLEAQHNREKINLENENLRQKEAAHEAQLKAQRSENQLLWGGSAGLIALMVVLGFSLIQRKEKNKALAARNREIAEQKNQIAASLSEKEVLLKEIHHRVKNNLQVVSSLLNLQANSIQDESVLGAVREGQNRVNSMALIHKKLYQTQNLSTIDFQEYLEQLLDHLQDAFGRDAATVAIQARDVKLDIDTAVPLGLIINELVSNAYKYAFGAAGKGNLLIELNQTEARSYCLSVQDDGAGLPENFSWEEADSLGLRLVYLLAQQLKGNLNYSYLHGAQFRLEFQDRSLITK